MHAGAPAIVLPILFVAIWGLCPLRCLVVWANLSAVWSQTGSISWAILSAESWQLPTNFNYFFVRESAWDVRFNLDWVNLDCQLPRNILYIITYKRVADFFTTPHSCHLVLPFSITNPHHMPFSLLRPPRLACFNYTHTIDFNLTIRLILLCKLNLHFWTLLFIYLSLFLFISLSRIASCPCLLPIKAYIPSGVQPNTR